MDSHSGKAAADALGAPRQRVSGFTWISGSGKRPLPLLLGDQSILQAEQWKPLCVQLFSDVPCF